MQELASCPEGSEHGIGGLRMAPGDVAHIPRTPSPVAEAGPVAEHSRSRARLRRLLAGLRPSTSHRSLRSLRRRGFAHYVWLRHYRSSLLAKGKYNSLTFVRGADRACCAPRKWPWKPTMLACTGCPHAPRKGHWRAHPAAAPCRPLNILSIMRRQVWRWNSESPIWYPPGYPAIRVPCRQCDAAVATSPA